MSHSSSSCSSHSQMTSRLQHNLLTKASHCRFGDYCYNGIISFLLGVDRLFTAPSSVSSLQTLIRTALLSPPLQQFHAKVVIFTTSFLPLMDATLWALVTFHASFLSLWNKQKAKVPSILLIKAWITSDNAIPQESWMNRSPWMSQGGCLQKLWSVQTNWL